METNTYSEDAALIGERQAAARALLAHPLISARTRPTDFALVRSHTEWLVQRFQRVLGHRLFVADDHARLIRRGGVRRPTVAGLRHTDDTRFTPRTHTYFALALAVLVEETEPTTILALAGQVRAAAVEAGVDADPARGLGERRAFCVALQHLADLGALGETSGTIGDHAEDAAADPALLPYPQIARAVAVNLPGASETPEEFLAAAQESDPEGDQAGETALRRLLAENAVVYREDLPDRQRDRLAAHQWRAAAALENLLGCETEIRAEGVALVMTSDATEHTAFPSDGPVGQVASELLRHLAGRFDPGRPTTRVLIPEEELEAALDLLGGTDATVRAEWARTAGPEVPEPDRLREQVVDLLTALGLLREGPDGWELAAAAARYGSQPDDRLPPILDNGDDGRTHTAEPNGSDSEHESASTDPRNDLDRVTSVLQAVANEKVSATSGDPGDQRSPRDGSG